MNANPAPVPSMPSKPSMPSNPSMPSVPSMPSIPSKPSMPPATPPVSNQTDAYGCVPSAGYYWSPSEGLCCNCSPGQDPAPWVCSPAELPTTGSMDWWGCKRPSQLYDVSTQKCSSCVCVLPQLNK